MKDKKIYILLGPSGAGKTTIGNFLREQGVPEILSHTTRPMRVGEENGKQYYFVTKEEWDALEKIEESTYSGNYYCLSRAEVEAKLTNNHHAYIILNLYGAGCIRKFYPDWVKIIYIYAPEEEMRRRMLDRGDSPENVERRIKTVREAGELNYHQHADYIIENISLDESLKQALKILEEQ